VEVWHLKVSGKPRWGRMPHVLAKIDSARAAGLDVTANQYPYIAAATSLDASIPQWAHSGGMDSLIARLKDPRRARAFTKEMLRPALGDESTYENAGAPTAS